MHTHIDPQASSTHGMAYPSAQWLYDEIMQHIEPELMTDQIGKLEERYKDESPEEREDRLQRYTVSFIIFQDALQSFEERMRDDMLLWYGDVEAYVHGVNRKEETDTMRSIEDALAADSIAA